MKVLYAEDEPVLSGIITDGLKESGYEVFQAHNGHEAFELFKSAKPDICILDIMMPLKDGYRLADDIRQLGATTPIIFLSAKSLPEDVIKGFRSGGNDYLKKPFNMGSNLYSSASGLISPPIRKRPCIILEIVSWIRSTRNW